MVASQIQLASCVTAMVASLALASSAEAAPKAFDIDITPESGPRTFRPQPGTLAKLKPIGSFQAPSESACLSSCNQNDACRSIDYHRSAKLCRLFDRVSSDLAYRDEYLHPSGDVIHYDQLPFSMTRNAAISGHNREHKKDLSVYECAEACEKAYWCESFDYYTKERACDLADVEAKDVGGLKKDYPGDPYDHYDKAPYCGDLRIDAAVDLGTFKRIKGDAELGDGDQQPSQLQIKVELLSGSDAVGTSERDKLTISVQAWVTEGQHGFHFGKALTRYRSEKKETTLKLEHGCELRVLDVGSAHLGLDGSDETHVVKHNTAKQRHTFQWYGLPHNGGKIPMTSLKKPFVKRARCRLGVMGTDDDKVECDRVELLPILIQQSPKKSP